MLENFIKKSKNRSSSLDSLINESVLELSVPIFSEFNETMAYYRCAIMEVETKLRVLNEEFSLQNDRTPIVNIQTREKSILSIKEKLERLNKPFTIDSIEENLYDVAGVRVICSFQEDVYLVARALLSQDDITLIKTKDYIENPKTNGYRSLHLIVEIPIYLAMGKKMMKVEIQLRTIAMDSWATLEHQLRYKKDLEFSEEMSLELLRCAEISAELDERMDNLKNKLNK